MLYHCALFLTNKISFLNVVHYISFRAMAALLTSLLFSFLFGNWFIEWSRSLFRSKVREHTPASHQAKNDMPTMGGLFILSGVIINSLLWCNWWGRSIWIFLFCMIGFGLIGFLDDRSKIRTKRGISAKTKALLQLAVAACTAILLVYAGVGTFISFPFLKLVHPAIGLFFIPWVIFILVGCSNAVNLTDGLDGLAITSLIPNFATFSIICFLAGNATIAHYLKIPFANCAELTVIGATLIGSSIGFLWYNSYPAQIFMGDVGSLGLGAALALMAIMSKQELLLPISGALFVGETLSVIVQVFSFKFLHRRIFRMAPIHHHFELIGWQESKITARFGIISFVVCLLALMTLKMR